MLHSPLVTRALNAFEERAGQTVLYRKRDFRISDLVDFLFHTDDLSRTVLWTSQVDGARFIVPVDPCFPRPHPRNDPWGPATYWRRVDNRKIRQFYELFLRRHAGGTFLDVGANWGMHTYPFAAAGYQCVCFEPQSICCAFIRRMCGLNGFTNVTIAEHVVGAERQAAVPFFESEVEAFSSLDEQHVARYQRPWLRRVVECATLDAYCAARGLAPTFIKIDTEGFEWEVLQGGAAMLREHKPGLLIEVSSSREKQQAMWDWSESLDYRCYAIQRTLRRPYPRQPFALVRTADEFLAAAAPRTGIGDVETDADFIFLQPREDIIAN